MIVVRLDDSHRSAKADTSRLEGAATKTFPDIEALPSIAFLPNPFQFHDGSMVQSRQDWARRREELAALAKHYVFGSVQQPDSLSYRLSGSHAQYCTLTMTCHNHAASFEIAVSLPRRGQDTSLFGPYPGLIVIGALNSDAQRNELKKHGYAVIEMPPTPIYRDDSTRDGAYTTLFPYRAGHEPSDSGALMAWAWGVSRIIDALEQGAYPDINPRQTLVTGVSRYGKAALLASAFDPRIAISIPVDTGQAGASSFRYTVEGRIYHHARNPFPEGMGRSEKISNMVGGLSHWFSSQFTQFENREDKLPFDAHSILALVAPRPLLLFAGDEFDWLSPPSTVLSYAAAREVYEFLGAQEALSLNVRSGPHAIQDHDIPIMIDFANHALRGTDYRLSKDAFPFVDTYHAYPYLPDSSYMPWSRPGKHTLFTATEQILAGWPAVITVQSDADSVTLEPPGSRHLAKPDAITETVVDGQAVFHLDADQAVEGTYSLHTNGGLDRQTIHLLGTAWNDAFRSSITRDGKHHIIHFQDRYDRERVRVFINGLDITDIQDASRFPDEMHRQVDLMPYGIRISGISDLDPDAHGIYHIELTHLRFLNILGEKSFKWSQILCRNAQPSWHAGDRIRLTHGLSTSFSLDS